MRKLLLMLLLFSTSSSVLAYPYFIPYHEIQRAQSQSNVNNAQAAYWNSRASFPDCQGCAYAPPTPIYNIQIQQQQQQQMGGM